jgi:hypothetical protein
LAVKPNGFNILQVFQKQKHGWYINSVSAFFAPLSLFTLSGETLRI